jgi:hypothetical protein
MVFANMLVTRAAEAGVDVPFVLIVSNTGPLKATTKNAPERSVEYTDKKIVIVESQLLRLPFTALTLSHL